MSKIINAAIGVVVLIVGLSFGQYIADLAMNSQEVETPELQGLSINRDTYVKGCMTGVEAEVIAEYGEAFATAYCGCTYDKGVAQYGAEQFTKEMKELAKTNTVTPELNEIVNACVSEGL